MTISGKDQINFGEAEFRAEQDRRKDPSGCGSRIGVRREKGAKKAREP